MLADKLLLRISQGGKDGVKKAEIKKEFQDPTLEEVLNSLVNNGQIIMDKKGTVFYLWLASSYLEYMFLSDFKFRLLYGKIDEARNLLEKTLKEGIGNIFAQIQGRPENVLLTLPDHYASDSVRKGGDKQSLDSDEFRLEFDLAVRRHANPLGWVLLSDIRKDIQKKYELDYEEFYSRVKEVTENHYNRYEISSGGVEGITVRGLVHGFVRCI